MKWIKGIPPNTGDVFTIQTNSGVFIDIHYCIQLGWIDEDRNPIDEKIIFRYLR